MGVKHGRIVMWHSTISHLTFILFTSSFTVVLYAQLFAIVCLHMYSTQSPNIALLSCLLWTLAVWYCVLASCNLAVMFYTYSHTCLIKGYEPRPLGTSQTSFQSTMSYSTSTFPKLNNYNCKSWSGDIQAWLMSKELWMLIAGDEPCLGDSDKEAKLKWKKQAQKAAGEWFLSVDQDQKSHFHGILSDHIHIWMTLCDVHMSKKPRA